MTNEEHFFPEYTQLSSATSWSDYVYTDPNSGKKTYILLLGEFHGREFPCASGVNEKKITFYEMIRSIYKRNLEKGDLRSKISVMLEYNPKLKHQQIQLIQVNVIRAIFNNPNNDEINKAIKNDCIGLDIRNYNNLLGRDNQTKLYNQGEMVVTNKCITQWEKKIKTYTSTLKCEGELNGLLDLSIKVLTDKMKTESSEKNCNFCRELWSNFMDVYTIEQIITEMQSEEKDQKIVIVIVGEFHMKNTSYILDQFSEISSNLKKVSRDLKDLDSPASCTSLPVIVLKKRI